MQLDTLAAALEQPASVKKRIKSGRARNEDGAWDHVVLRNGHGVLTNTGSIAPTRMLAVRYGVTVTMTRNALAGHAEVSTTNDIIPSIHDPFRHGKA
jgi:hypothetical protein